MRSRAQRPATRLRSNAGLLALGLLCCALNPAFAEPGDPRETPKDGHESAAERRAVRGVPVDDGLVAETPELRELQRFEEQAFPRVGIQHPLGPTDEDRGPLPPGLGGRWSGSGDIPPVLRTPEAPRADGRPGAAPESDFLRSLKLPEIPIRWDPRLVRYLEYFKSDARGRAIMAGWLRRLGRYKDLFTRVLEREGLPNDLVYLAMIESGFEASAISRAGAGGFWQFMPGAARAYGLEVGYWVDRRRDPERAAEAAARYLKDLYVRFGSWHLAFAAYNAGYGAVLRSIGRYNTNDYWELCRHEAGMPWETSLYVPKILAAAIVGHNRELFGYGDVAMDPPVTWEWVAVPPGTSLATVARAAGVNVEVVLGLNAELVRGRTPPDRGASNLRLPPGTAAVFAQNFERVRLAEKFESYVVRFGESLDDIARARGTTVRELRKLNGLRDTAELRGGATILVPPKRDGAEAALAKAETASTEPTLVAVPERTFSFPDRERVFYRTRDGDSLEEIAEALAVDVADLAEWNALDPDAKLQGQMVLQAFVKKGLDLAHVALLDPDKLRVVTLGSEEFLALEAARRGKTRLTYAARPGDTLTKIARRYGLAPGDLARINRMSWSAELTPGQPIVVYSPTPELPREISVGRSAGPHRRPETNAGRAGASTARVAASNQGAKTEVKAPAPGGKLAAKADPKKPGSATVAPVKAPAPAKPAAKPAPAPAPTKAAPKVAPPKTTAGRPAPAPKRR